jgi:hypothetical protein
MCIHTRSRTAWDDLARIAERAQSLLRDPRADDVVGVELHSLRRDRARLRLPEVVHQRREPEHEVRLGVLHDGVGVTQDVLVLVHRVLFQSEGQQLGEELLREAGLDDELEPERGLLREQQLVELVADPLRRDDRQAFAHPLDRVDHARGRRHLQRRGEPGRAEHPQRVLGERDLRLERRVDALRGEILQAAERVLELPLRRRIAIALIVKSLRERSVRMSLAKVTTGLRFSSR